MTRKIAYWGATGARGDCGAVWRVQLCDATPQAIENFRHVGYPQQLRVLLGIAKLAGAIVLLLPRLPKLKEWAYAGFTFTWIAATVAHYLAGDGLSLLPVALLGSLAVSYVTRSANRRGLAKSMLAQGDGSTTASGACAPSSPAPKTQYGLTRSKASIADLQCELYVAEARTNTSVRSSSSASRVALDARSRDPAT